MIIRLFLITLSTNLLFSVTLLSQRSAGRELASKEFVDKETPLEESHNTYTDSVYIDSIKTKDNRVSFTVNPSSTGHVYFIAGPIEVVKALEGLNPDIFCGFKIPTNHLLAVDLWFEGEKREAIIRRRFGLVDAENGMPVEGYEVWFDRNDWIQTAIYEFEDKLDISHDRASLKFAYAQFGDDLLHAAGQLNSPLEQTYYFIGVSSDPQELKQRSSPFSEVVSPNLQASSMYDLGDPLTTKFSQRIIRH